MGLDQYAKLKTQKLILIKYLVMIVNRNETSLAKACKTEVFMNNHWIKQNQHKYAKQLKDSITKRAK